MKPYTTIRQDMEKLAMFVMGVSENRANRRKRSQIEKALKRRIIKRQRRMGNI